MTVATSGSVNVIVNIQPSQTVGLASAAAAIVRKVSQTFTDGTGADQIRFAYSKTATLAASGTEDIDLNSSLTDAFGNSITITKLKFILVVALAANTNDVLVGGAGSHAAAIFSDPTDVIKVKPGGTFLWMAPNANGQAVVAATSDVLTVTNSAGTTGVTYDIIIGGC